MSIPSISIPPLWLAVWQGPPPEDIVLFVRSTSAHKAQSTKTGHSMSHEYWALPTTPTKYALCRLIPKKSSEEMTFFLFLCQDLHMQSGIAAWHKKDAFLIWQTHAAPRRPPHTSRIALPSTMWPQGRYPRSPLVQVTSGECSARYTAAQKLCGRFPGLLHKLPGGSLPVVPVQYFIIENGMTGRMDIQWLRTC